MAGWLDALRAPLAPLWAVAAVAVAAAAYGLLRPPGDRRR